MRTCHLFLALVAVTGCGERPAAQPGGGTSDVSSISKATFAPQLGVDLSAMQQTPRGAYVRDLSVGTGDPVGSGTRVAIHYVGTFPNGKQFDANEAPDAPFVFRINAGEVVPGFDEAVTGMRVGGKRLAIIPPALGYGANDYGPIPGNSILVFTLELVRLQ